MSLLTAQIEKASLVRIEIHKMIDEIPEEKNAILLEFIRFLRDGDDCLSEQDIAELDAARAEIEAGEVSSWEDARKRLEALP